MSTQVPRLLDRLVDDAAVFPPGSATLSEAVAAHRQHRTAWYADLVGPLLAPVTTLDQLPSLLGADEGLDIGIICDVPLDQLARIPDRIDPRLRPRQLEAAVAKRGEDPQPGLTWLTRLPSYFEQVEIFAEIPLTWGLLQALDTLAHRRSVGQRIAAKFRTGGLAAELFPTPIELAAVICACRDRDLPFKLTAGLHHAVRHTDPETGFTHHGFLNVLAAAALAADGAEVAEVAEVLAATDPVRLVEPVRQRLPQARPLWTGFGSCSVGEPLADLVKLALVNGVN